MATLTATEQARLGIVRPELFVLLLALMDDAGAELGFKLAVPSSGGLRSTATQRALYEDALKQGGGVDTAYAVAKPGTSRHEFGAAFDVHIVAGGHGAAGIGTDNDYRQLADLGERRGALTAGYYFKARGQGSHSDPFHFQLNEAFATSVARWQSMELAGFTLSREVLLSGSPLCSPASSSFTSPGGR